ncbi:unnamed protein product, partial [Rotaria sp. Silwood2]
MVGWSTRSYIKKPILRALKTNFTKSKKTLLINTRLMDTNSGD